MKISKKQIKYIFSFIGIALIIAFGIVFYLFNMPARDVQDSKTDFSYQASAIVNEYLENPDKANNKYLSDDGNSKILEITGIVAKISEDFIHQKVILLQSPSDKAGVSCTFTKETNPHTNNVKIGETITVKGVIRSGASYDSDLEMYENVIIEKCDIVSK